MLDPHLDALEAGVGGDAAFELEGGEATALDLDAVVVARPDVRELAVLDERLALLLVVAVGGEERGVLRRRRRRRRRGRQSYRDRQACEDDRRCEQR